jgi:hypothetical protein
MGNRHIPSWHIFRVRRLQSLLIKVCLLAIRILAAGFYSQLLLLAQDDKVERRGKKLVGSISIK